MNLLRLSISLLAAAVLCLGTSAESSAQERRTDIAITISPIHLVLPIVELTGEFALDDNIAIAGILGAGSIGVATVDSTSSISGESFTVLEFGSSFRYYLVGDFDHGMQVGGELLYVYIDSGDLETESVTAFGQGLAIGPFIGYKIAATFGLTFEIQAGGAYVAAFAQAENTETGETSSASDSDFIPIVNLQLGWSF